MQHPTRPPAGVLVLRAWVEVHPTPLRVHIVRIGLSGERTATVVSREDDVLAIVTEWLRDWSTYGRERAGEES